MLGPSAAEVVVGASGELRCGERILAVLLPGTETIPNQGLRALIRQIFWLVLGRIEADFGKSAIRVKKNIMLVISQLTACFIQQLNGGSARRSALLAHQRIPARRTDVLVFDRGCRTS